MEDIDKEIELAKLKLRILELEKELNGKEGRPIYIPIYYPQYPYEPYRWSDTTGNTDSITITL